MSRSQSISIRESHCAPLVDSGVAAAGHPRALRLFRRRGSAAKLIGAQKSKNSKQLLIARDTLKNRLICHGQGVGGARQGKRPEDPA